MQEENEREKEGEMERGEKVEGEEGEKELYRSMERDDV